MSPHNNELEDDLPQLPPLDDDGETALEDEDLDELDHDEHGGLDDATAEDDPLDRWAAFAGLDEEGGLLDGGDAEGLVVEQAEDDLLEGAEVGLLDDSDEGDGRDASEDDVGALEGDEPHDDDGGAEGTGEDPSEVLEAELAAQAGEPGDDDAFDDDARFSDGDGGRARDEREPWPPRVDAAWSVTRLDASAASAVIDAEPALDRAGALAATIRDGALAVSNDGGATWSRVPGCHGATAIAVVPSAVLAALYDPLRETSAVVLLRAGASTAELVADILAEEGDDDEARIVDLRAREAEAKGRTALEIFAKTSSAAFLLRARS